MSERNPSFHPNNRRFKEENSDATILDNHRRFKQLLTVPQLSVPASSF
jgi:hypothetical protein